MENRNDTIDERYMRRALELARKGEGHVNPNPMVGAVIVKDGEIIGEGYHEKYGELHAERNALKNCSKPPKGADLYVTLEPCCHYGKTPPCTDAIIESGIKRVIVGSVDANPLVAEKGVAILRKSGIEVTVGVLQKECEALNKVFFHYMKTGKPYVTMKYAMTLDGKIATYTGASKWITGEAARNKVHEDRGRFMAIMVGIGTVLADDPLLTCRIPGKKTPIRIICDTHLRTPLDAQIVKTAGDTRTILAVSNKVGEEKKEDFKRAGCEFIELPEKAEGIDLEILMQKLGEMHIDSILLEGGGTLNDTALKSGIVSAVQAYIAPKIFGGAEAKTPVEGTGIMLPGEAFCLKNMSISYLENDILIEGEL